MVDEELMRCIFRRIFIVFFIVCIYQKPSKEHYRKYYGRLDSSSQLMKVLALILLLVFVPVSLASTYTLGSHQVSFNVSEPYNSIAKLDPPTYNPNLNSWLYTLNMTNDSNHFLLIQVHELPNADYGRTWPGKYAEYTGQALKDLGVGGHKSSTMDFKGYPAYQFSYPGQNILKDGRSTYAPENKCMDYQIDERTVVQVWAIGDNVPYQEVLDTIKVIEAPAKPTEYAPYISSSAGNSTSE